MYRIPTYAKCQMHQLYIWWCLVVYVHTGWSRPRTWFRLCASSRNFERRFNSKIHVVSSVHLQFWLPHTYQVNYWSMREDHAERDQT